MTQPIYKTEKRKAHVGERILITNADYELSDYHNGGVFTVTNIGTTGVVLDCGMISQHHEYEVIVGEHTPAPNLDEMSYDELVALSEAVLKALRTRSYKLGYAQGRFDEDIEAVHGKYEKSDQQKRDEIVEQAKVDIEALYATDLGYRHDFIVNAEKRTVVALRKSFAEGYIRDRGIAKCAPNDCFNVHIGKAIALRRALGLEVPPEYLNVPQPTEVRVGDVVEIAETTGRKWKTTVHRIENGIVRSIEPYVDFYLAYARRHGLLATDPRTIDDTGAGEGE